MKIFKRLKRGAKAAMSAIREPVQIQDYIQSQFHTFMVSEKRKLMLTGVRYYEIDNDIINRKKYRYDKATGKRVEDDSRANNKLPHGMYKNMVDEKISYTLSKEYTLTCEDKKYLAKVQSALGKKFSYKLLQLGYEASNKGTGWLHPYINEQGDLQFMICPAEQIIPEWEDNSHESLKSIVYFYDKAYRENGEDKIRTHMEYWTADGMTCYTQEGSVLFLNRQKSFDDYGNKISHFIANDDWTSWGKVPFIAFKNNLIEKPDIKFVKRLIDGYDKSRSEVSNYIEEIRDLIYVIKGYGNADQEEVRQNLNSGILMLDNDEDEDNSASILSSVTDITAAKEHCEQLKRDIVEAGQGVLKDLDKFGNSPSGVALSFMYSFMDLKAGILNLQFQNAFEDLLYFINVHLNISTSEDVKFSLNMNMKVNETENLQNCQVAKNLGISEDTWLSKCVWVDDVEKEKLALAENMAFQDKVPIRGITDE